MIHRWTAAMAVAWAIARAAPAPASAQRTAPDTPRATLYAFWATWCVPCRVELPHLERIYRTHRSAGLRVLLVSEDAPSTAPDIPAFLARYGVTAPWVLDRESALLERYNPAANLPFVALVRADGTVAYAHAGYEPGDERRLEAAVRRLFTTVPTHDQGQRARAISVTSQGLGVWRTSRFDPVPERDGVLRGAVGRVEVAGRASSNTAMARVDGAALTDDLRGDDTDARLERIRLGTEVRGLRVQLGDGYASFGNGLSLSLRKIDPLGVDTSLRGLRVNADVAGGRATLLVGHTNPQNVDPLELGIVEDVSDFITGGELSLPVGKRGTLAPYTVVAHAAAAAPDGGDVTWLHTGASARAQLGEVQLSAEAAAGMRDGMALRVEYPWAAYASAQWRRGRLSGIVDAKAYRHWSLGRRSRGLLYHEPPTLERDDQEVPANDNALGARARLEVRVPGRTTVFGNGLAYRYSEDGTAPLGGDTAVHGYVGVDKRLGTSASVSVQGGVRREVDDEGGSKLRLWHVDADAAVPLTRRLAVTLKWNHRSETKVVFDALDFVRGLGVLGLSLSGLGTASVLYGYSTERRDGVSPTHYPAVELLLHLPRGGNARLFVGQLAGGRVCVSGSCRDVPPFRGARFDLVWRH